MTAAAARDERRGEAHGGQRVYRVLHVLPDLEVGGGQQLVLRNIAGMQGLRGVGGVGGVVQSPASRFEHVVCVVKAGREGGAGGMEEQYRAAGVEVVNLGVRGVRDVMRGLRKLRTVCRERGIDLIHTNNTGPDRFFGQLASLACGLRVVNTLHAEPPPSCTGDREFVKRQSFKERMKIAGRDRLTGMTTKRFVAVSERVRAAWRAYLDQLGVLDRNVSVVMTGLDTRAFRGDSGKTAALRKEIAGDASPVLMDVARLVEGKGLEFLPRVVKAVVEKHARAKLVLVGDGPMRGEVEQAFEAAGVGVGGRLVMLGNRADVPALLGACDVFVFPSVSEGFGLVVLEAMAAGKAVVAFDLPALREFVDTDPKRGSGVLVKTGDGEALAAAVVSVVGDAARMKTMGERGRKIVEERFSLRASVEALARVYLDVLEG